MNSPWQILVASSNLENRRALMQILQRQGLEPIAASTLAECHEFLQNDTVGLIFCDFHLTDGSYRDLLDMARSLREKTRVVLTAKRTNWDEYLEAMRLGAFDVIGCPCRPTDVEWMVIQAKRDARTHSQGPTAVPSVHAAAS
jgi:DNA-binding NtrC family response regulator